MRDDRIPDNRRGQEGKAEGGGENTFADALSNVQLIESVLGGEDARETAADISFQLPLSKILELLPEKYVLDRGAGGEGEKMIAVTMDDLLHQLSRGKREITISAAKLALGVPAKLLSSDAFSDEQTMIALPLATVVGALDPEMLRRRMAQQSRVYDISGIADPFTVPKEAGEAAAKPAPVQPAPSRPRKVKEPPRPAAAAVAPAEEELAEEPEGLERLGGINLNAATEAQLTSLDGVSFVVARSIIEYRQAHGPFRSIFSLADVPHVGRMTFRKITGMPFNPRHRHRGLRLAKLLGLPLSRIAHLPTVAQAVAERLGSAGCVISDAEGLLLAESGAGVRAESISAIAPKIVRQVRESMEVLKAGEIDSVSMCVGGAMFTIVARGNIHVTCFHDTRRLTGGQLSLVGKVAGELAWLFSHRGYIGR